MHPTIKSKKKKPAKMQHFRPFYPALESIDSQAHAFSLIQMANGLNPFASIQSFHCPLSLTPTPTPIPSKCSPDNMPPAVPG